MYFIQTSFECRNIQQNWRNQPRPHGHMRNVTQFQISVNYLIG